MSETVTVEASAQQVNTTDATVSTVVDRQFRREPADEWQELSDADSADARSSSYGQ